MTKDQRDMRLSMIFSFGILLAAILIAKLGGCTCYGYQIGR